MNKNLHNTTGVHFVSSRIIESISPPPPGPCAYVRTYVRTRQGERDRGAARKGGKVREEGRGTGGERREKKKGGGGVKEKKESTHHRRACSNNFIRVSLHSSASSSTRLSGRVQIEFKVAEIAIEIFTRMLQTIIPQFAPLIPPPSPHPVPPTFFSAAANRYLIAREPCSHSPDASRKH